MNILMKHVTPSTEQAVPVFQGKRRATALVILDRRQPMSLSRR